MSQGNVDLEGQLLPGSAQDFPAEEVSSAVHPCLKDLCESNHHLSTHECQQCGVWCLPIDPTADIYALSIILLARGTAHFSTGLKGRNMTLHRNKVKAYVSEMPWRACLEVLNVTTTTESFRWFSSEVTSAWIHTKKLGHQYISRTTGAFMQMWIQ